MGQASSLSARAIAEMRRALAPRRPDKLEACPTLAQFPGGSVEGSAAFRRDAARMRGANAIRSAARSDVAVVSHAGMQKVTRSSSASKCHRGKTKSGPQPLSSSKYGIESAWG